MSKLLAASLAFLATAALAKDPPPLRPQPANTYPAHEAHEDVIVAVDPYDTPEKSKAIFGKHDPLKIGILPLYVVITNNSKDAVRMDSLKVELTTANRESAGPIPAAVVSLRAQGKKIPTGMEPRAGGSPIPRLPRRADTGAISAIVDREFLLRMIPPGETVGGFLFFDTGDVRHPLPGGHLYMTGLTWARTGRELLFFEVPFDKYLKRP
jgi:hypothetical protein